MHMSPTNLARRQGDPTRVNFWHSTAVVMNINTAFGHAQSMDDWNKLPPDVLILDDNNAFKAKLLQH